MNTPIENINAILDGIFSWPGFFSLMLLLVLLFFVLRTANKLLTRSANWGKTLSLLKQWIQYTLLIYEPLALIVIVGAFVMINPIFHGLLLFLAMLLAFSHLRNYFSGRLLLLNPLIAPGRKMSCRKERGIIVAMGRQGISLQTQEGIHIISYTQLMTHGYAVEPGDEVGGYFNLQIGWDDLDDISEPSVHFMDMIASAPYLDRNYKPEILSPMDAEKQLQIKVLLLEESHLFELISLIREWGYSCQLLAD